MLGWELPPHYVGGMGVVCYSLCEHLAKSGADIEFILPFEADYSDIKFMKVNPDRTKSIASGKISYSTLDKINATAYGKADISSSSARKMGVVPLDEINDIFLQKVMKASILGNFDIIHAHDWLTLRGAMLAKRITGLPLVVHIHATEFDRSGVDENERGNEMIHLIEYEGMMMADTIIAVSQWTKDTIVKRYRISPDKIQVVHNSIDLDSPYIRATDDLATDFHYLETMQKHGYSVVINAGRQSIQKGLPGMLEAAKLALEINPKIIFVMVGSGDMHNELIEKTAYLGISRNVMFTGFIKGKQLRDIYKIADLFVMPSVSEPFGSTPLEAIGLGTPVLITKQSGVSEVIKNALKVDFWDAQEMANSIVAVTMNQGLKEDLTTNGYSEFLSQSWIQAADKTLHAYQCAAGAIT